MGATGVDLCNRASVDAINNDPTPANNTASQPTDVAGNASIDVEKTGTLDMTVVAPSTQADVGDKINYSITVDNNGNVTLSSITVSDPNCTTGPTYVSGDTGSDGILGVTETWTYSCSHSAHPGRHRRRLGQNTVGGAGTRPGGGTVNDTDTVTVTVPAAAASIDVEKIGTLDMTAVAPSTQADVGDKIGYSITVDNNGNGRSSSITVSDPNCTTGPTYVSGDTDTDNKLDVTETWTYTCSPHAHAGRHQRRLGRTR